MLAVRPDSQHAPIDRAVAVGDSQGEAVAPAACCILPYASPVR